jgi:predicted small secreted protein
LNARQALLAVSALLTVSLTSCGTMRRAGKDLFIGIGTPVLMVYGGATDGYGTAKTVRAGLDGGSAVEVVAFPFTFLYHALGHGLYGVIHIIDFPLCLFYGAAELHPSGPEVRPLDFYQGTWFDIDEDVKSGTDAESGETLPPGYKR